MLGIEARIAERRQGIACASARDWLRVDEHCPAIYSRLTFWASTVLGETRDFDYLLETDVRRNVPGGNRTGVIGVTTTTQGPVADDPWFLESILSSLLLPVELSERIDDRITQNFKVTTTTTPLAMGQFQCSSIGIVASPPNQYKNDEFVWDVPAPKIVPVGSNAAVRPRATLYFDRILRNQTTESIPPSSPFSFTPYINGMPAHIPRMSTIPLAPNASYNQKYCRTISMEGLNSLQILFTDNVGGAVWSQFTAGQDFGSGVSHKMTTGRSVVTAAPHPGDKPVQSWLRDFELDYRIDYSGAPKAVSPSSGGQTKAPMPGVATSGKRQPDSGCTRI
jgi:hypothetical protein